MKRMTNLDPSAFSIRSLSDRAFQTQRKKRRMRLQRLFGGVLLLIGLLSLRLTGDGTALLFLACLIFPLLFGKEDILTLPHAADARRAGNVPMPAAKRGKASVCHSSNGRYPSGKPVYSHNG